MKIKQKDRRVIIPPIFLRPKPLTKILTKVTADDIINMVNYKVKRRLK